MALPKGYLIGTMKRLLLTGQHWTKWMCIAETKDRALGGDSLVVLHCSINESKVQMEKESLSVRKRRTGRTELQRVTSLVIAHGIDVFAFTMFAFTWGQLPLTGYSTVLLRNVDSRTGFRAPLPIKRPPAGR